MWIERVEHARREVKTEEIIKPAEYYSTGRLKSKEQTYTKTVQYKIIEKPTYHVHTGTSTDVYDDTISRYSFQSYQEACEFVRFMYGGEMTNAVKAAFDDIDRQDVANVGKRSLWL